MPSASEVFARTILALEPYAEQIVFIGGWVHAIYLADAGSGDAPIRTEDIDITIPRRLLTAGRPTLIELVESAGYDIERFQERIGTLVLARQPGPRDTLIDLDILTDAANPRDVIAVEGQAGLAVQGYPGQIILLENNDWVDVGMDIHELLNPARPIKVPTIGAYVFQKGLSSSDRTQADKQAKDLVYTYEIVRHPILGPRAVEELDGLALRYDELYQRWCTIIRNVIDRDGLRRDMADQLITANRARGSLEEVMAAVAARFRRLLAEAPQRG